MELISKKVLVVLCALCLTAAVAEGYLLYKSNLNQKRAASLQYQLSHPFAVATNHFLPWDVFPRNFMPQNFMKDFDDDSFFGNKFPSGSFFEESLTLGGPKREDKGDRVNLTFDVQGHEKANFDVRVTDRQITLIGKDDHTGDQAINKDQKDSLEPKPEESQMRNEFHWSMTQSFPLPDDVDPKNYTIERSGDNLTVVFKKISVANSKHDSQTENL